LAHILCQYSLQAQQEELGEQRQQPIVPAEDCDAYEWFYESAAIRLFGLYYHQARLVFKSWLAVHASPECVLPLTGMLRTHMVKMPSFTSAYAYSYLYLNFVLCLGVEQSNTARDTETGGLD